MPPATTPVQSEPPEDARTCAVDFNSKDEHHIGFVVGEHFSGRPRMNGGAMISPALLKSTAEKAAQDNKLDKQ